MREIPELQVLCLRAIGSHACSVEKTFEPVNDKEPSCASRLLRRFHARETDKGSDTDDGTNEKEECLESITRIPMYRKPCIGHGSSRRVNANEVDLNHPMIACRMPLPDSDNKKYSLVMQYGSTALDCLQSYIDSLVELGRMDDTRLGVNFFNEWKANVLLQSRPNQQQNRSNHGSVEPDLAAEVVTSKKRKRMVNNNYDYEDDTTNGILPSRSVKSLGSLSLHNCTIATDTFEAMVKSGMGQYLAVLDVTGVHGMTDDVAKILFTPKVCSSLVRVSLKNCRKISKKTIKLLPDCCRQTLECLDIGGCFNILPTDVLDVIPNLPNLSALYASGLQWTDELLPMLIATKTKKLQRHSRKGQSLDIAPVPWEGLSFGFCSINLTQHVVKECLIQTASTIQSLSIPFCEQFVDNTLLGIMGRNLPILKYLDIRGNYNVNTMSAWYDGRISVSNLATTVSTELTVLARYTSITETSLEETRRVHPQGAASLIIFLDATGTGSGIAREYK